MVIKKVWLLLLFIIYLHCATAYSGVSPGTYTLNFEPNSEAVFNFNFLGDIDSSYEVYAEGNLAQYATLNVDELNGGGSVNVLIEFPSSLEPGPHVLYVGARESSGNKAGISVNSNVRGQIIVSVPYPGKYVTMQFFVENASMGEEVKMKVLLDGLGNEDANFDGKIKIYDERGKFLEEFNIGEYTVSALERKEVLFDLDTTPYPAGRYFAEAYFEYESGVLLQRVPFRLGELIVNIIDATRKLDRGTINEFNVIVESEWNDPIDNVYAEVNVFGQNIKFTTPSIRLEGFSRANLTGFFDTTGIIEDNFNVNVKVFYEDKFTEKFVKLGFKDDVNYFLIGIITATVIFLIIIVILIIITIKLRRIKDEIGKRKK